jgi:hypothetical protein
MKWRNVLLCAWVLWGSMYNGTILHWTYGGAWETRAECEQRVRPLVHLFGDDGRIRVTYSDECRPDSLGRPDGIYPRS